MSFPKGFSERIEGSSTVDPRGTKRTSLEVPVPSAPSPSRRFDSRRHRLDRVIGPRRSGSTSSGKWGQRSTLLSEPRSETQSYLRGWEVKLFPRGFPRNANIVKEASVLRSLTGREAFSTSYDSGGPPEVPKRGPGSTVPLPVQIVLSRKRQ